MFFFSVHYTIILRILFNFVRVQRLVAINNYARILQKTSNFQSCKPVSFIKLTAKNASRLEEIKRSDSPSVQNAPLRDSPSFETVKGYFKKVSMVFQGRLKGVSREFSVGFKDI